MKRKIKLSFEALERELSQVSPNRMMDILGGYGGQQQTDCFFQGLYSVFQNRLGIHCDIPASGLSTMFTNLGGDPTNVQFGQASTFLNAWSNSNNSGFNVSSTFSEGNVMGLLK